MNFTFLFSFLFLYWYSTYILYFTC